MYLSLVIWVSLMTIEWQLRLISAGSCKGGITNLESKTEKQYVRSPNYPNEYFNNELCRWHIEVENSEYEVVRFQIQNTYIRNSAPCQADYVDVKDVTSSRTIRLWCGEWETSLPATSSGGAILITFRTDGKYTDKGFEIAYWSVPKSQIEYSKVEWRVVNFVLFAIFFAIVISIILGMFCILLKRKRIDKIEAKLAEEREAAMYAVHVEQNGKLANGNPNSAMNTSNTIVTKRTSANNGEANVGDNNKMQVMCLEPTIGNATKNDSSMTPV